jgi:murein DD-endopeptidase MepM/ murein hydrolase activator NlpD
MSCFSKTLTAFCVYFVFGFCHAAAQVSSDDAPNANMLMAEAVDVYREAEGVSGRQRVELFRKTGEILERIRTDFPDSVPAQFMSEGRALGPIDMDVIEAANDATYLDDLPQTTLSAVFKVSGQACRALSIERCELELAEALFEYIAVLAFDLDRSSNVEQLRWLFSNPGQLNNNLARVNAFEELMSDEVFRDDFINRVNGRVMADLGVEITVDVVFSLLTGVVSETLAQHYEAQGYQEAADFTRTWMEPIVDISLVLEGASSASTAGAGVGAALIWAKNTYAFWQLGEKQFRAEQTGATADQQLDRLASEIDSYTRTLISGRLTGVAFEGSEGAPLTERHAEVIKSVLEDHYEMQQYWLSSDDAILLETFDAVLQAARAFYVTLGRLFEPTPLDAADGSGALPADLQGAGLQPAPDGFLGPPTGSGVTGADNEMHLASDPNPQERAIGQVQMYESLPDGLYGADSEVCAHQGEAVIETLDRDFRLLERPRLGMFEQVCDIVEVSEADSSVEITLGCNVEGYAHVHTQRWQITGERSFVELDAFGTSKEFRHCEPTANVESNEQVGQSDTSAPAPIPPTGNSQLTVSAGFFDPTYPAAWNPPAQHLGIDLPAPNGTTVRSPIVGEVVLNRTDREDAFNKYLIIRDKDGLEHVFAHLDSSLVASQQVSVGDDIGAIVSAGTGPHLHWGINQGSITSTFTSSWGFGRAPLSATEADARAKGWIDPEDWFEARLSPLNDEGIEFVFPKDELDQVAALSNGGELRSTGFNVDITDRLSVNCTHWVTQGAGAASDYGITTWQALLPKLQCNVWSDNGDGSSGLVPNIEVSAALSNDGAMIMKLAEAAYFQKERQGDRGHCAFSIQNQVFDYKKEWSSECQEQTTTPTNAVEFTTLIDGLYGRSSENCSIDPSSVGDRWFSHYRSIRKPEISGGYESYCSVLRTSSSDQTTTITASCNTEGEFSERQFRWQVLSTTSFVDLNARGGPAEFRLCEAETAPPVSTIEWTSAVVHTGGYGRDELTACLFNTGSRHSTAECLMNDGASDETIRFAEARATEGGEGPEVPVGFKELGKVDIVFLDSFAMSQNEWEYFVNTSPESISAPMYPERDLRLLSSRGDPRAQAIIRQFPGATAWKPFIGGMRVLPNGHQRFSNVVYWTENCRACPIVGYNLATVDFGQNGRFRAYETRGVFDNREHAKFMGMTANDLRRDEAAVQLYLNLRGYDAGPMDGALGPRTRAALSEFQKENNVSNGLGIPDQATLEALVNRETLFANGSGNALNSNGEHDPNEAVGLVVGNNAGSCVPVGNLRCP